MVAIRIKGNTGQRNSAEADVHVHPFDTSNGIHQGLVTLTHPFLNLSSRPLPFLNPTLGAEMNIDAGFTGNPEFIYEDGNSSNADSGTTDGATTAFKLIQSGQNFTSTVSVGMVVANTTDTTFAHVSAIDSDTQLTLDADIMATGEDYTIGAEWPGTATEGGWTFTPNISITSANNSDQFTLNNAHTTETANYIAVTGNVTLQTWSPITNDLIISLCFDGVVLGNTVNLNDFINASILGVSQSFVIPFSELGIADQTVNQFNGIIVRDGGAKPSIDIDDIQFEKAGGAVIFETTIGRGEIFRVQELSISFANDVSSAVVAGTMLGLDYTEIVGLSTLTNGFNFQNQVGGEIIFNATVRQISDLLVSGAEVITSLDSGTNTFITIMLKFDDPVILNGDDGDKLIFIINDDMSGLDLFRAVARGSFEI